MNIVTIAITNDDGYTEGALILLRVARRYDTAYALLPERQRSAVSAALTLHKPLRLTEREKGVYTLSGNPADCAIFAIHSGKLPKPDVLLSGINWGDNAGVSPLISSGTIGACWKAALYGVPSIAFSIYRPRTERLGWLKRESWHSELLEKKINEIYGMLKEKLSGSRFFVVNLPSFEHLETARVISPKKLQNVRFKVNVEERHDPYGHPYYWVGGEERTPEANSDLYEVAINGNITIKEIKIANLVL
ncbi:MAG: 5'/3'-nucleotidase SurE [Candidatus Bilamarchaeaceae archaeon]